MKRKWILFHCQARVYTVTYNTWLSSTAMTRVTSRLHEGLDVQRPRIKFVYRQVRATSTRQVCIDWELAKADDKEATVSAHAHNDVKQY